MKWTTDRLACALFMKDWKIDYETIAKELGCTVKAVERKIGINYKTGRARLVSDSVEAQARHELRRALSAVPTKRKRPVAIRKQESFQVHRIRRMAEECRGYVEQPAARNNSRAVQTRDPVA
jgi:hypothetical protein